MEKLDNKKIGTHNSMTYLKPASIWGWLGRFIVKCQSLTIQEQLDAGVRIFDLRIRKNDNHEWVFAHGMVEFKGEHPIDVLVLINSYEGCKVRLMWQTEDEDDPWEAEEFVSFCKAAEENFTNIKFFGGTSIATWKNWYNFHPYGEGEKYEWWEYTTDQFVSSIQSVGFWPWLYTALKRKSLRKKAMESDKDVVLIDFVKKDEFQ